MKFNTVFLILTAIFCLGLVLRIVALGNISVSLFMDEATIGYNSYSILKTGKDEFGTSFPLVFRSTGDYKPPLLIYTMIPAITAFGLNEFGVRITTAVFGALTIIVAFFVISRLTKNNIIALLTSFSLAISPSHIKLSRATHDATLAFFLVSLGVAFFFWAIKRRSRWLWLSSVFFALSLYTYHAERVFVPLLVFGMVIIYRKELLGRLKESLIAVLVGVVVSLPIAFGLLTPEGQTRANMTFLAQDFEISRFLHTTGEVLDFPANLLDNNALLIFNFWAKRYLDYFDLSFLFIDGMEFTMDKAPDLGLLYLFELPFFLLGAFLVVFRGQVVDRRARFFIILWFLLGPLAASLANNEKHVFRVMTLVPIPQMLAAVGIWFAYRKLRNIKIQKFFVGGLGVIGIISVLYFADLYFLQYQRIYSELLMYGWKDAAQFALSNRDNYKEIVIDPRFGIRGPHTVTAPYVYILFFGKIDPGEFQNDPRREEAWDSSNFANFTFREIDWRGGYDKEEKSTLFIGSKWVLPAKENEIIKRFYLYNGDEILRAVTPK